MTTLAHHAPIWHGSVIRHRPHHIHYHRDTLTYIDHAGLPHVIERILHYASDQVLFKFRTTAKRWRSYIDLLLVRHIRLLDEVGGRPSFIFATPHRNRIPGLYHWHKTYGLSLHTGFVSQPATEALRLYGTPEILDFDMHVPAGMVPSLHASFSSIHTVRQAKRPLLKLRSDVACTQQTFVTFAETKTSGTLPRNLLHPSTYPGRPADKLVINLDYTRPFRLKWETSIKFKECRRVELYNSYPHSQPPHVSIHIRHTRSDGDPWLFDNILFQVFQPLCIWLDPKRTNLFIILDFTHLVDGGKITFADAVEGLKVRLVRKVTQKINPNNQWAIGRLTHLIGEANICCHKQYAAALGVDKYHVETGWGMSPHQ